MLNAFSAMGGAQLNGARRLIVRTKSIDASNVLVELQDSGTGIAPEKLESIFDPFITNKRDGLGIGLAISRTIVERHSGKVWAANNPDRGATFSITLPVSASESDRAAPARALGAAGEEPTMNRNGVVLKPTSTTPM